MGQDVGVDIATPKGVLPMVRSRLSQHLRLIAGSLLVLILCSLIGIWLADRARFVSTNDARIAADMIAISSDVSGQVVRVAVSEGDEVAAGDLLYQIDDRAARHLLDEFRADENALLAAIEGERRRLGLVGSLSGTQIDESRANVRSAQADVQAAQAALARAERDFARADNLLEAGLLTQPAWDGAETDLEAARQALKAAEADLASSRARAQEALLSRDDASIVEQDLLVLEARLVLVAAKIERQNVLLDQHKIRSPIAGIVDELFYDIGERTLQGFRVALLHNPKAVWISANIKETQIADLDLGAPVDVKVDSLPGTDLSGRLSRIGDLTLAEAAMMPNPNASGVFTKITQRINVRIDLETADVPLRPGSMVTVRIRRQGRDG